jgi:hypothetical protein
MTASVKRKAAPVDLSAPSVTALEAALADKPLSLMIVAEYRDGVRVFSYPKALRCNAACTSCPKG